MVGRERERRGVNQETHTHTQTVQSDVSLSLGRDGAYKVAGAGLLRAGE